MDKAVLAGMPKIEVHRHLEGSYPIEQLFQIAIKNELDVPRDIDSFREAYQFPKDHEPDFLLFLSKFKKFWYKSLDDISSISYETVKSFLNENLHYVELRFNPLHFTELTKLDPIQVTRTIMDSSDSAASEIGLQIRYLLTFNRGVQTAAEMIKTYRKLHEMDLSRVVGIDLAGDEINYPPESFSDFFDIVKKDAYFDIDIHAGEVSDSKNMWTSIEQLHADRIGHGVAAVEDEEIQEVLKKKKIFLAQCITSNYQTGAWRDEKTHPMKILVDADVPVTIGSDDPTIQASDLTDDYLKAAVNFGWTVDDLIRLNFKAIDSTFLNDEEKVKLHNSYSLATEKYRKKFHV